MALNQELYLTKLPRAVRTSVDNTASPGLTVASNSGSDPSRVFNLVITGDTAANRTIEVRYDDGTNTTLMYVGEITQNSGLAANNPALDLVRDNIIPGLLLDGNGNQFIDLPNGHSIKMRTTAAPTTNLICIANIRDFAA